MSFFTTLYGRASIAGVLLLMLLGAGGYWASSTPANSYIFKEVVEGSIREEVSASGNVEPPARLDLHFKGAARLVSLPVAVGDTVSAGDTLAAQDVAQLSADLEQAQAGIDVANARLEQLVTGATLEDIQLAETAVANATQGVADAKEILVDVLQDAYTKVDDAISNKVDQLLLGPKSANPQLSFAVTNTQLKSTVESERVSLGPVIAAWGNEVKNIPLSGTVETFSDEAKTILQRTKLFLGTVADAANLANPSGSLTQATIDKWKTDISTARTNINASLTSITAADKALQIATGTWLTAKDQLALIKAPARPTDIALRQAEIRQAEAAKAKSTAALRDATLVAPSSGIVVDTNGHVGEVVGPETTVVSLIPKGALEIKLNVSENDIVHVSVGQDATITLDAFGNGVVWQGKVVAIDPAETVIGGAVYYKTTVLFSNEDSRVRSGMTADVLVDTATKENTLLIPVSALSESGGMHAVEVMKNGSLVTQTVEVGIRDRNGMVEILSGLSVGDRVVVGVK